MTAAACACGSGAGNGAAMAGGAGLSGEILLSVPGIRCVSCIAGIEDSLQRLPGVRSARVNLSLKRVAVDAEPGIGPDVLVTALGEAGFAAQELDTERLSGSGDAVGRDLLLRLGVAGFAMMNVMLLSVAVWSGAAEATRQLFHLIAAMIALPAVVYSARPFFVGALASLSAGRLGMDVPIALAILLATVISLAEALVGTGGHAWFDAALSLTFFLLAGRYLDHRSRAAARGAAEALAALEVPRAVRLSPHGRETVATADLRPGDRILVLPGSRAAADGRVVEGESDLDRSAMTGETAPALARPGDAVLAGEAALNGTLTIEVTRAGPDTALSRMTRLVADAEEARARHLSIADRAARAYAPIVHILAALAFAGWWWATGEAWIAAGVAIAVLIITCPCALGLAVPAVTVAATGRLFRAGLLVTSRTALERFAEIDTVVFDKTGTLTTGTPEVVGEPDARAVAVAMGLAEGSGHPASRAIVAHGRARGIAAEHVSDVEETPGQGLSGTWRGRAVTLGRGSGGGPRLDGLPGGAVDIALSETLRQDADGVVAELVRAGYDVRLLSGDASARAEDVARRLGIPNAEGAVGPEGKSAVLDRLASEGRRVLMIGDGLNDAPALARAHAAISPGSALDAARQAADAVILGDGLEAVPLALATARKARGLMRGNLWMATLYNVVAVPLALAGLATPLLAALAMSASSVSVSLNALRAAR